MNTYELVTLRRLRPTPATEEYERLRADHLTHLESLFRSGELALVGRVDEQDSELRAVCIYRTGSLDEARRAAEADPLVQAGYLGITANTFVTGWRAPDRRT